MASDHDIAALLPEPPPPRPARREAAIDLALRRFDGEPASPQPVSTRPRPVPEWWRRPQMAALASIALVVMISLPVWWLQRDRIAEVVPQVPVAQDAPSEVSTPELSASGQAARPDAAPTEPGAAPAAPAPVAASQVSVDEALLDNSSTASLEQQRAEEAGYTTLRRAPPPPPPPPPAPPPPASRAARQAAPPAEAEDRAIVVTGSRVSRPDFSSSSPVVSVDEAVLAGGNWSACTILDDSRDLSACPTRRASGLAATQLTEGLSLAWQGDLDGAITAFGRAIRTAPDFSLAYLNRGLAYQSKGDLRRALSDFNRAIDSDRNSAAAYYYRSELHRARGDAERADADARRAGELVGS